MNPTDIPTNNEDLLKRLLAAVEVLDNAIVEQDDRAAAEAAMRAYSFLRAPKSEWEQSKDSPTDWSEIAPDIRVMAWCVVKDTRPLERYRQERHERGESILQGHPMEPRVWPGCAFLDLETAYEWVEFLEDYFYDTHVRDQLILWRVEWRQTRVIDLIRGENRKGIGEGYGTDRSRWVGSLPMRKFKRVITTDDNGYRWGHWERLKVIVS